MKRAITTEQAPAAIGPHSVLDLHCDTLMKLAKSGNLDEKSSTVTLRGLKEGGVALQCFADFVPTGMFPKFCRQFLSEKLFQKMYRGYQAMMARHQDVLFPVLTGADVERPGTAGKIGVRLVTLTWNHPKLCMECGESENCFGNLRGEGPPGLAHMDHHGIWGRAAGQLRINCKYIEKFV